MQAHSLLQENKTLFGSIIAIPSTMSYDAMLFIYNLSKFSSLISNQCSLFILSERVRKSLGLKKSNISVKWVQFCLQQF